MLADIRDDYDTVGLLEKNAAENPYDQFDVWMQDAIHSGIEQPNAMTLATASSDGVPSARIVLLKEVRADGFVFFTNYRGRKSYELDQNPRAALVFLWLPLSRQVRVEGRVKRISASASDAYFESRPVDSQIGAWASPQSEVIESREKLQQAFAQAEERFGKEPLTRPPHWGGYCLEPHAIEFWQGQPSRLHDRLRYRLSDKDRWIIERLAP